MTGERIVFGTGPATDALYASAALAGILPPAEMDGRILVDGGYSDLAPVDVVWEAGADVVVVVDAATNIAATKPANGLQAIYRAIEICQNEHTHLRFKKADLVIHPDIAPPAGVLEFKHKRRCAAAGARRSAGFSRRDLKADPVVRSRKAQATQSETQNVTNERYRP